MAKLTDAGWTTSHETLFEAMARLDHPDAHSVLTMLGKHSGDKKTAKAARKAAFKSASLAIPSRSFLIRKAGSCLGAHFAVQAISARLCAELTDAGLSIR
jgi:hypothetical protein